MKMIKRALVGISVMGLLACQGGEPEPPPPQRSTPAAAEPPVVEILRDQYGMPHIFASDNYGVYYGYGYALAQDRLYQMEILKRTVQGRVAEVLGEKFVALDTHIRSSYELASVADQLQVLPAEQRQLLQAYADGFNRHIEVVLARPDSQMPKEFEDNGFKPELWRAYDVAMLFAGAIAHRYSDFNSERDNLALLQHLASKGDINRAWNIFSASKWLLDADSPTTVPAQLSVKQPEPTAPSYLQALPSLGQTRRVAIDKRGLFQGTTDKSVVARAYNARLGREGFGFSPEFAPASNFWALANTRTQGAEGVLVNGPQFGWGLPSYVYGVALHGGDFDVVGNTLLGLPALLFAHNNHIAWGSTAGLSDQVDEYYLRLNPENPEQYWHDGQYKNFKSWSETIKVKGAEPLTITARRAAQGMVLMHQPEQGLAVARARAWEGKELASLMAWVELSKRKTIAEAKAEVGKVATNINFYYMDKTGNIAYTHAGRYPVRAAGHDPRIPAPGDGRWDWRGLRSYQENPTVEN
ncbi:MAG: penicillin acylase family protein, partial [Cellvibrionaceae bacterium]|nr:penicillin acylase family protein [Cellvibrionaceae bacterium]